MSAGSSGVPSFLLAANFLDIGRQPAGKLPEDLGAILIQVKGYRRDIRLPCLEPLLEPGRLLGPLLFIPCSVRRYLGVHRLSVVVVVGECHVDVGQSQMGELGYDVFRAHALPLVHDGQVLDLDAARRCGACRRKYPACSRFGPVPQ
jgi:hypothetical protein